MVREIGISLFLACVGLGAGKGFIETIINEGGYIWIGYGAIITVLPLLIVGFIGRYVFKLNYYTLIGVLSGAITDSLARISRHSNGLFFLQHGFRRLASASFLRNPCCFFPFENPGSGYFLSFN